MVGTHGKQHRDILGELHREVALTSNSAPVTGRASLYNARRKPFGHHQTGRRKWETSKTAPNQQPSQIS